MRTNAAGIWLSCHRVGPQSVPTFTLVSEYRIQFYMAVGGTCHVQVYSQRPHHEYGSDRDGRGHRRHPVCVSVRKTRAQSTCRTGPLACSSSAHVGQIGHPRAVRAFSIRARYVSHRCREGPLLTLTESHAVKLNSDEGGKTQTSGDAAANPCPAEGPRSMKEGAHGPLQASPFVKVICSFAGEAQPRRPGSSA
jgi:hypothetical protein